MFFKPNTRPLPRHQGMRRREISANGTVTPDDAQDSDELPPPPPVDLSAFYESPLYKSPDPRAVARSRLDPRVPSPPDCPHDKHFDPTFNLGAPDVVAKWFHPNEKGHEAMAAFAIKTLAYARAKQQGVPGADVCDMPARDEFTCWRDKGRKAFVTWGPLDKVAKEFCEDVEPPANTINWEQEAAYHKGTPDEVRIGIQLNNGASHFDKARCLESMARIIHGCTDGGRDHNPLNFKYGGHWVRGDVEYHISPQRNRTMTKVTDGACRAHNKGLWMAYKIHGRGWSSWDWGKETLKKEASKCVGSGGLLSWEFEYYDKDGDNHEWEWWATFTATKGALNRCFNNLKVQGRAGGYTHKMTKDYEDEEYTDFGCST
jgi:hypothetical protein